MKITLSLAFSLLLAVAFSSGPARRAAVHTPLFSLPSRRKAPMQNSEQSREDGIRLPVTDGHYQRVKSYVEDRPEAGYHHASAAAYEAFRDMKYGVRIHWGLYSIQGLAGESWPFLSMSNAQKQAYQEQYKTWNPTGFDAEAWMRLFQRVGLKCFAFTSKHHEGFSMFATKTRVTRRVNWTAPGGPQIEACDLAYSIMETPFHRDVVKELCDAAHRHGIKIDLYFSHPDWYDADFRPFNYHPLQTPDARAHPEEYGSTFTETKTYLMAPDKTPEETARMLARHRQQLVELLTRYGKIDMLCLDQWMGPSVWPEMRETIETLRALQPDVMLRCRGIGNYGDYYTPEGFVPGAKENTEMPWMVIYPLAGSFSYVADPKRYKGGDWIVSNLVDTVAKGGNFMVGIGPDRDGWFHPKAIEALEVAGQWLKVNGEAIYGTRPRPGDLWKEGAALRFTQTKEGKTVYALALQWPGATLRLTTVRPRPNARITLLGYPTPLKWRMEGETLVVSLPESLQEESQRPCRQAWAFRIPVER